MMPHGRRDRIEHRRGDHGVGASERVQEHFEEQASGRRAGEIEEVGAIDTLDSFANGERHHCAGEEERHRAGEIDGG